MVSSAVWLTLPDDFISMIDVAACFIEWNGKALFVRRHPGESHGNCWAIPGGKFKENEDKWSCVKREVLEESGIIIDNNDLEFKKTVYIREHKGFHFTYHIFTATFSGEVAPQVTLSKKEATALAWFTRAEVNELETNKILMENEMTCIELTYGNGEFDSFKKPGLNEKGRSDLDLSQRII